MSGLRFLFPLVALAGLMFACETPAPDDQIRPLNTTAHNDKEKKATPPKKPTKPTGSVATTSTTGAGAPTHPNTTPTTTDAKPTTPTGPTTGTTPAPTTTAPPANTTPPTPTTPPAENPPAATQNLVEVDCCIGTQFIVCVAPPGSTCADVNVDTDCSAEPTFDDACF